MNIEYAIIVKNKTRLELLIERFNTRAQAKFYIERSGGDFHDYELEDATFHSSLHQLQTQLSKIIHHKVVERHHVPSFIFSENQVIIAIGQDGLVANTAKYAQGVPIIGVNPDKQRYDGILLPFDAQECIDAVQQVMSGNYLHRIVHFAAATLNDRQRLLAFNDLFIGAASHVSARYKISFNNLSEEQSSSGIIVSTPAGSTGWLSSVFNMAYGITGLFEKQLKPKQPKLKDDQLLFIVREPFKSVRTHVSITSGSLSNKKTVTIESLMPAGGVIFSDGIESDFLQFNSGAVATVGISDEFAKLVLKKRN